MTRNFMLRLVLAAALAILLLQSDAPAQQPAAPAPSPQNNQSQPDKSSGKSDDQSQESVATFKSNVSVVNLYFSVKDHKGGLIASLTKDDFRVFDEGKPQVIKYFKAESDQPLTLGLLIDTSPSQMRVLPAEQQHGSEFLRQVMTQKDLAFVISFDANITLEGNLSSNAADLSRELYQTHIGGGGARGMNPGPVPSAQRACCTYLYDAVYLAASEVLAPQVGRKAVILLTDGQDEGSKLKLADAIEAAHKADTICYVIMIADRGFYSGPGMPSYSGDREMKKLAEETGGRVINVGNDPKKLRQAFDQLAAELRMQYNIGYTPAGVARDGTFHKVQIKTVKDDYKVQARAGYYAVAKP